MSNFTRFEVEEVLMAYATLGVKAIVGGTWATIARGAIVAACPVAVAVVARARSIDIALIDEDGIVAHLNDSGVPEAYWRGVVAGVDDSGAQLKSWLHERDEDLFRSGRADGALIRAALKDRGLL